MVRIFEGPPCILLSPDVKVAHNIWTVILYNMGMSSYKSTYPFHHIRLYAYKPPSRMPGLWEMLNKYDSLHVSSLLLAWAL